MPKPPQYRIWTLQDIFDAVTPDNKDRFMVDFENLLDSMMLAKVGDKIWQQSGGKSQNITIKPMTWIDDGKHNGKVSIADATGDKIEVNIKH